MKNVLLLVCLLMCAAPAAAHAQSFDLTTDRQPVASLDGLWRFHTGDNPQWASPSFDDSQWPLLRSEQSWDAQGYKGYSGFAWYRFTVAAPASLQNIALMLPTITTCYEVYADGQRIGAYGKLPPHAMGYLGGGPQVYKLPAGIHSERKIEIALRVWQLPGSGAIAGGGPASGGGLIGDTSQIESRRSSWQAQILWDGAAEEILALLQALAGLGAVALFLFRRRELEYLWFGLAMLSNSAAYCISVSLLAIVWPINLYFAALVAVDTGSWLTFPLFYRQLLKPGRSGLLRVSLATVVAYFLIFEPYSLTGRLPPWLFALALFVSGLPIAVWMLTILISKAREGSPDARLLLIPHIPWTALFLIGNPLYITYAFGWQHTFTAEFLLTTRPFPVSLDEVVQALFPLAVFGILVHRFTRTRSQEERFAAEVQSARNVQQYLIPEHLPDTPGLVLESVYRPSREVGGDFFQVLPQEADGSALIVVGDVAGKGMQAGMLATLIVGAIRTAASFTNDPAQILGLLNERMHGRGLATCLALRIEKDGNATLANAGHLPPYLNGKELPMEGALPLGAIPSFDFPVLCFKLAPSDSLMLMTDGVAEAQDAAGRLFGFDRIAEMLRGGIAAAALATAAQDFGQEDDITVLTVARAVPAV